jgi:hypothetical protein
MPVEGTDLAAPHKRPDKLPERLYTSLEEEDTQPYDAGQGWAVLVVEKSRPTSDILPVV